MNAHDALMTLPAFGAALLWLLVMHGLWWWRLGREADRMKTEQREDGWLIYWHEGLHGFCFVNPRRNRLGLLGAIALALVDRFSSGLIEPRRSPWQRQMRTAPLLRRTSPCRPRRLACRHRSSHRHRGYLKRARRRARRRQAQRRRTSRRGGPL